MWQIYQTNMRSLFVMTFWVFTLAEDVTYPPDSALDADKTNILIGGLLPLDIIFGKRLQATAQVAIDEINKRKDVLGDYNLVLHIKNVSPDGHSIGGDSVRVTTIKTLEYISENPMVHMIYGNLFASNTESSAYLTGLWNVVQVTPLANALQLSDKVRYPYLVSLLAEDSLLNDLTTHFIKESKWTKVSIITDLAFDALGKLLGDELKKVNVTVPNTFLVDDEDDPADIVASIKESGVHIIVIQVYQEMHYKLLCEAYKQNMYAPRYVWIANNMLIDDFEPYYSTHGNVSCTWSQIEESVEGQFGTSSFSFLEQSPDTITIGGENISRVFEKARLEGDLNKSGWSLYGYDSIWTMALAMSNTIKRIAPNTLEEFTYKHKNYTDLFLEEMKQLSFPGATGPVSFTEKRTREEDLSFQQIRSGKAEAIAYYDRSTQTMDFRKSTEYMWEPYGNTIPNTEPRLEYTQLQVSAVLFAIYSVIACAGIVICFAILLVMFIYRDHSAITYGWPIIRAIVCIGCLILNIAVILMGIDEHNATAENHQSACQVASWLLVFGFTLAVGGMLVNSFAMYHFHTKGLTKSVQQELKYCIILAPCFLLDVLLLVLWQSIDPLNIRTEYLQREYDVERDTIYQTLRVVCDCNTVTVWRIVMLVYKAIILLFAAFITWPAWLAAHGKGSVTGHYLGICIYVTVLAAVIGIPVTFSLGPDPSVHYGVAGGFILLCTISTSIVILCTMLFAKRNPHSSDTSGLISPINSLLKEISESKDKKNPRQVTQNGHELNGNEVQSSPSGNVV
ncbi:unnamed protein product [Owenia fusiformis]|uniref:Uncharacterized protein n=1 Tax=Owenia fusiformis TaxID=6347 RepID=A0A8J1T500_OWEFU|nr:unnamed protein product [Owenia fusiformis]